MSKCQPDPRPKSPALLQNSCPCPLWKKTSLPLSNKFLIPIYMAASPFMYVQVALFLFGKCVFPSRAWLFFSMESVVANIWNAWFCPPKNISCNHDISLLKIQLPINFPMHSHWGIHSQLIPEKISYFVLLWIPLTCSEYDNAPTGQPFSQRWNLYFL